jgi:hypothetical protein
MQEGRNFTTTTKHPRIFDEMLVIIERLSCPSASTKIEVFSSRNGV